MAVGAPEREGARSTREKASRSLRQPRSRPGIGPSKLTILSSSLCAPPSCTCLDSHVRSLIASLFAAHVLLMAFTSAGLIEVFRAPALQEHYAEHQQRAEGKLTVVEFVLLHYCDPGHEASEPAQHAKLPFHGASGHSPLFTGHSLALPGPMLGGLLRVGPASSKDDCVGQWASRSVFHPPKSIG